MTPELRLVLEKSATRFFRLAHAANWATRHGKVRVAFFCDFAEDFRVHRMLWLLNGLWCRELSFWITL